MKLIKRIFPMSVVLAMLVNQVVYAETTIDTDVDDINGKLTVTGTFDSSKKDWITLSVYEGKYTLEEIIAMEDSVLESKLTYFNQDEFTGGNYAFDFEFSKPAGWYTTLVSGFEDNNTPNADQTYYYQTGDVTSLIGEYNGKIVKPNADYVPTSDGPLATGLAAFLNQYKDSFFSDIEHFFGLTPDAQKDVARSQIGMQSLSFLSEIKTRVEKKSIQRILSEKLVPAAYNGQECISYISNNALALDIAGTAEFTTFTNSDEAFKLRVAERMQGMKMDQVSRGFRETVVLVQIEKVTSDDLVTGILSSAQTSLGLNLSKYNGFSAKNVVNTEIAGKTISSVSQLISDINTIIDNYVAPSAPSGGGGGGGGAGGGADNKGQTVDVTYQDGAGSEANNPSISGFSDFKTSHWAYTAVDFLKSRGIVSGYNDGTFKPDKNITRAEFVKMIVSALGIEGSFTAEFADVSGSEWFAPYVYLAEHYNIVYGNENGEFRPNDNITRQDAAVIAYRAATFLGTAFNAVDQGKEFADADAISDYASSQVSILKANGIVSGDGGYFNPTAHATRAQMSQLIYSLLMRI